MTAKSSPTAADFVSRLSKLSMEEKRAVDLMVSGFLAVQAKEAKLAARIEAAAPKAS